MKKRFAILLALTLIMAVFAGCGKEAQNESQVSGDQSRLSQMRIAQLIPGVRGVSGIYDMVAKGLEALDAQYHFKELNILEANSQGDSAGLKAALSNLADLDFDVIITNSAAMADVVAEVAGSYKDTQFIIVDSTYDFERTPADNVYSVKFLISEPCFAAGMEAMMLSKTGTIGFIGTMDNVNINDFLWGYVEGAKYVNPDGRILIGYTGSIDAMATKEIAQAQIEQGADVLFPVCATSSEAAIDVCVDKQVYCVGVDQDRETEYKDTHPERCDVLISSVTKDCTEAVEIILNKINDGTFVGGFADAWGFSSGAARLIMDKNYTRVLTAEQQEEILRVMDSVETGELTIGTAYGKSSEEIQNLKNWATSGK